MPDPAAARAVEAAEHALGLTFPDDYRDWRWSVDGVAGFFGPVYLELWALDRLVELNAAYQIDQSLPGAIAIGLDGGGEAVVYDYRHSPPPLALAGFLSAGWHEAVRTGRLIHRVYGAARRGPRSRVERPHVAAPMCRSNSIPGAGSGIAAGH